MGNSEPERGQQPDATGAGVREEKVFASNSGVCVEEPLREGEIALNLGCGHCIWPGWVNVDGFDERADVTADLLKLPYVDGAVDRIAAIHVLEHFYLWDARKALKEWLRVLKPGGRLAVELPSMDSVFGHIGARMRKGEMPSATFSWFPLWGDPRYENPAMMHKWGYFRSDVQNMLTEAGFVEVEIKPARYHFPQRDMRCEGVKP